MFRVELMTNEDIEAIIVLMNVYFLKYGKNQNNVDALNSTLLKQLISNEVTSIFKASDEESKIVGFMSITESQSISSLGNYGIIDEMFVLSDYKNQNIEKMLLQKARFIGQVNAWDHIELSSTNETHIQFYKSIGFTESGTRLKI